LQIFSINSAKCRLGMVIKPLAIWIDMVEDNIHNSIELQFFLQFRHNIRKLLNSLL